MRGGGGGAQLRSANKCVPTGAQWGGAIILTAHMFDQLAQWNFYTNSESFYCLHFVLRYRILGACVIQF